MVGFGTFGVGGEASEALEGGVGTSELEFEFERAFLERGHRSETVEASLEISEGRDRLGDECVGLKPELRFGFREVAQRVLKIVLGAEGIAATCARSGAKDAGGGVSGMGNKVRCECVDGRERLIAREKILRPG